MLNRINLERLKIKLNKRLRDEQAGFRKEKSCADHVAAVKVILKHSIYWNSPVYMIFADYEKAFDGVDKEMLRTLLTHPQRNM